MNFGSPCVGNAAFARAFAEHVSDSWRVHCESDVIAYLPRGLGYVHVGNDVKLTKSGHLELARGMGIDPGGLPVDPNVWRPALWALVGSTFNVLPLLGLFSGCGTQQTETFVDLPPTTVCVFGHLDSTLD
jgi:hypothetical protein